MLYLLLAILCSALLSVVMRLSKEKVIGNVSMLAMNYVMCFVIAGLYAGVGDLFPAREGLGSTLGMGVINGVFYLASFLLLQKNIHCNGVVLSTIFMKLSLLVPMVVSILWFGEIPALLQIVGFLIAVAAIVLINFGTDSSAAGFKIGLIFLLLVGGGGDTMAKIYEELGSQSLSGHFLFYTFGVALILCICLAIYKKERPGKWELLYGLLLGIPNYFSARFLLRALEHVAAVIVFPTFSVGTILVVTLTGVLLFKERLGKRQWIAVAAILAALILLNI